MSELALVVERPLIATLRLNDEAARYFNHLRETHFPADRNFLPAHVTLFHHLPGERREQTEAELDSLCRSQNPFPITIAGLRNLGKGVAFRLTSSVADQFRQQLAQTWWPDLTIQDKQRFMPHVTIQNKVAPGVAKQLLSELQAQFSSWECQAIGVDLWRYDGGPWHHLRFCPFLAEKVNGVIQ